MAKKSSVEKNRTRQLKVERLKEKRDELRSASRDKSASMQERLKAQIKLSKMPRDSAQIRVRNRCTLTGRPRGYYRMFKLSRTALRRLFASGLLPGVIKSSW